MIHYHWPTISFSVPTVHQPVATPIAQQSVAETADPDLLTEAGPEARGGAFPFVVPVRKLNPKLLLPSNSDSAYLLPYFSSKAAFLEPSIAYHDIPPLRPSGPHSSTPRLVRSIIVIHSRFHSHSFHQATNSVIIPIEAFSLLSKPSLPNARDLSATKEEDIKTCDWLKVPP